MRQYSTLVVWSEGCILTELEWVMPTHPTSMATKITLVWISTLGFLLLEDLQNRALWAGIAYHLICLNVSACPKVLQCAWGKSIWKKITIIHCCIPKYPKFSILYLPTSEFIRWPHSFECIIKHNFTNQYAKKKKKTHTSYIIKTDNYLSKYKNLHLSKYKMNLHSTGETESWRAHTEPYTH